MVDTYWAHVRNTDDGTPIIHHLREHLIAVADGASAFAGARGERWAYLAGLWHDLGKYRPGFQHYIRLVNDAHIEGKLPRGSDKTHSAAGALHALQLIEAEWGAAFAPLGRVFAYLIAGHHAGLDDWVSGLDTRLLGTGAPDSQREYREGMAEAVKDAADLLAWPAAFSQAEALASIPGARSIHKLSVSLWVRMLFSALVDADFLDTEAFMNSHQAQQRTGFAPLSRYLQQLEAHLADKASDVQRQGRSLEPVMQARHSVLRQCLEKADRPGGVYALTVPTGGGKTLSSLAFALKHACSQGRRRVIYAIPYTSIIEQTADVFRGIFGADQVIEHHSQADVDPADETPRSRLASENWDAPLIVTTNVQLFESLFASRTSRCRKLHRIADSVIVLDEAQLLPPEFLQPIVDVLNALVAYHGVTLLLCTATQPVLIETLRFDPRRQLRGLPPPTPLIDDEAQLFTMLARVRIEWPSDLHTPLPTDALVRRLLGHDCVLVIVNTRADAAEIVRALDAADSHLTLHLSAAMCGQHRADTIAQIRHRLSERRAGRDTRPLRVVSTQLVEAGVDIDFPVVYRALAGLDSIAQAAGRCNREGALPDGLLGEVVVFVRELPRMLHALKFGAEATREILCLDVDPLSPAAFERYFPLYHAKFASLDQHGIVDDLKTNSELAFNFRSAAEKFKLVDDQGQVSVIVPYLAEGAGPVASLIELLRQGQTDRWLMRKLQRRIVGLRQKVALSWLAQRDLEEIGSGLGLYLLTDAMRYDARLGLLPDGNAFDPNQLVS